MAYYLAFANRVVQVVLMLFLLQQTLNQQCDAAIRSNLNIIMLKVGCQSKQSTVATVDRDAITYNHIIQLHLLYTTQHHKCILELIQ